MKQYKLINNITGWLVFLFAAVVYGKTIESSASFWDCGEFVPGCFKLEVVHPPGAPLFLMIGRLFTLFAGSNLELVPVMVNLMSGLASAFAVLFLFWSITMLMKKMLIKTDTDWNMQNIISIMGCGVIGAACGTFCDSFWFSAVEAEVYALSIFFLMFVIWAIFKWDAAEDKHANKWLIVIGYGVGLSLGVHLLSLLALPILGIIIYFRFYRFKIISFLIAMAISFASVPLVMKYIISGTPMDVAYMDMFLHNSMGLPFNSGVVFFILLAAATFGTIIYFAYKGKFNHPAWLLIHTGILIFLFTFGNGFVMFLAPIALIVAGIIWLQMSKDKNSSPIVNKHVEVFALSILFLLIGYSSYMMVPIRSIANPPINMNKPQDPFRLLSYLNREQYGDRPLLIGPQYTADQYDISGYEEKGDIIYKGTDKYEMLGKRRDYQWNEDVKVSFPRMGFWQEPEKIEAYRGWIHPEYNIVDRGPDHSIVGHELTLEAANAKAAQLNAQSGNGAPRYAVKDDISAIDNFKFFVNYQMGYMYFRYLMWNFSGRQNDLQGFYFNDDGRWITGIGFLDNMLRPFGTPQLSQENLPKEKLNNRGRNVFYMIPFILGIIGAVHSFRKNKEVFALVFLFWLITGIFQIMYLNQPPREPRERDYIFAGSVLAYSMFIGFAVHFFAELIAKFLKGPGAPAIATAACVIAPFLMGSQGWDDHDRSGRYIARDMAVDYLESCAPNAILFTQGDNDTYPLWYAQEVENIRPDIRIINLSLLGVDWYIDQLHYSMNNAKAIKLSFNWDQIKSSNRDVVRYHENGRFDPNMYYEAKRIMAVVADDKDKVMDQNERAMVNYLPSTKFYISVDSARIARMNILSREDLPKMAKGLSWDLPNTTLMKNDLITLDIIANNLWERPIYFAVSVAPSAYVGLTKYAQLEGMAYRIVPMENPTGDINRAPIRTDIMYSNLTKKFKWGNMADPKVYLDENVLRMTFNMRSNYARLASELISKGQTKRALEVMDTCMKGLPTSKVPLSIYNMGIPEVYYSSGKKELGRQYANELCATAEEYLNYYKPIDVASQPADEINRNLYILQQMGIIMKRYGDDEAAKSVNKKLDDYAKLFQRQLPPA